MELEKLVKEKFTLKEFETFGTLKSLEYTDLLFVTSNGFLIGKPHLDESSRVSSLLILTEVIILTNNKTIDFSNSIFHLSIDQIIAFSPIERDSFLSQF